jgi:DNA-binding transcriptional regulator YdaS (Cro superfamily)
MQGDLLLTASRLLGSQKALAKVIGAKPTQLNAWINMGIEIPFEYAIAIEQATGGRVTAEALSPFKNRAAYRSAVLLPVTTLPIREIHIKHQMAPQNRRENTLMSQLINEMQQQELLRPIAVDSNQQLIFGELRLKACQYQHKPTIACWRLNLSTLLQTLEQLEAIRSQFTISERAALGIALENCIGHRHGGNRRYTQVQNSALEPGTKLRDHLANKLGFGSHFTYEQAKKIYRCHMHELIQAVDKGRVAISTAVYLIELPITEQHLILRCDDKSIIAAAKQSKLRQQRDKNLSLI